MASLRLPPREEFQRWEMSHLHVEEEAICAASKTREGPAI